MKELHSKYDQWENTPTRHSKATPVNDEHHPAV
jgi:hypothetical protein